MAKKILLVVYPGFQLLLLVACAGLGYMFYVLDQKTRLLALCVFAFYVLYRFYDRSREMYDRLIAEEEDEPEEDGNGNDEPSDAESGDPGASLD